jgi:type I restriction enzyme S subunit
MFDPTGCSPEQLVRNFDLNDALQPVLRDEKEVEIGAGIGSLKKVFRSGDVVISRLRAYLREIAVVRTSPTILSVGSSEFIVLRQQENPLIDISSETLFTFLRSAAVQTILKWCQDGSQHPRFSEDDLLSIPVPDAVAEASPEIQSIVEEGFAMRQGAQVLLDEAKTAVDIAIEKNEGMALRYLDQVKSTKK